MIPVPSRNRLTYCLFMVLAAQMAPASISKLHAQAIRPPTTADSLATLQPWEAAISAALAQSGLLAQADRLDQVASTQAAFATRRLPGALDADASARQDSIGSGSGYREYEAGLSTQLWRQGERASLSSHAESLRQIAVVQRSAARLEIAGRVRTAWWDLVRANATAQIEHDQTALAESLTATTKRLYESGEMSRLDYLNAETTSAEARSRLAVAQGQAAAARATFTSLTGGLLLALPDEIVGTASVEEHPEVLLLIAQAKEQEAAAKASRLSATPAWRIGADIRSERSMDRIPAEVSTGIRLSRPIGRDPRAASQAAEYNGQATALRAEAAGVLRRLEGERAVAAAQLASARAAAQEAKAGSDAAAEALVLTLRGRAEGELPFIEEIRARVAAGEAERRRIQAQIEVRAALSKFNQSQGLMP